MKKVFMLMLLVGMFTGTFAQETPSFKKRPTLSVNFIFNDFLTAQRLQGSSIGSVLSNKDWARANEMTPGLGIAYYEGLSEHFDFMSTLNGTFMNYPFRNGRKTPGDWMNLQWDANINMKLLSDKHTVVPYLTAGVGAFSHGLTYFGAYMPVGGGLQVNLGDQEAFIFSNFQYRLPITANANYHFTYTFGLGAPLTAKKEPKPVVKPLPPPPPPVEVDTDKDGIVDTKDKCPSVPGVTKYNGCPVPDSDKDGVNDENDKCPSVAGLAKYNGCPIPDTDGDGINDEEDSCPKEPGVARRKGCPVPDTDKDGLNDEEDGCPNEAGPTSNKGCPLPKVTQVAKDKVEINAKNILFATGSAVLLQKSYKSLDEVVALLKEDANAELKLSIEGHTDNTGSAAANKSLSQRRANSVLTYLAKKGIDKARLTATGYGQEQPIADNKTAAGRAANRRVELKLSE